MRKSSPGVIAAMLIISLLFWTNVTSSRCRRHGDGSFADGKPDF